MITPSISRWYSIVFLGSLVLTWSLPTMPVKAQEEVQEEIEEIEDLQKVYYPIAMPNNNEITDVLSDKDIPTGEGGFARDYTVNLEDTDQVAIDLLSEEFDTIVTLMAEDGSRIAENDDGPDGSTNSLLFARISETGKYIIRVRAFGETGGGKFNLKVTRLRPIE